MANDGGRHYGVLLYYQYTPVPDLHHLLAFYNSNCHFLSLVGRVRLSPNGFNVTVGGELSSLKKHVEAVKSNNLFDGTDFKLASCHQPLNDKIAEECGFTSLSIRVVKELVTFQSHNLLKSPEISNAGQHLSATEFHSVLQSPVCQGHSQGLVLLDARNLYETRIGKFHIPGLDTLDPRIRQYSDLPSWIDENSEQLHGHRVLMYCTGGIRCEMASAYLRSKGAGFENVFQLSGGIQRYLEQFPDGGFFRGKNFVFDHRVSVGSSNVSIMGICLLCNSPYDDYSPRCRCVCCRMLVLVCESCQQKVGVEYICELCWRQRVKGVGRIFDTVDGGQNQDRPMPSSPECKSMPQNMVLSPQLSKHHGPRTPRKLRILCLHGFRQNASSFKGRTASLAKKLKAIADLVFLDAPHELPFIFQPALTKKGFGDKSSSLLKMPPQLESCRKKLAWFVAPNHNERTETDWKMASSPFDPLQYQQQTEGIVSSLAYLKSKVSEAGPFDGILGFSQGAAMAALLCAENGRVGDEMGFRFVILCSGFACDLGGLDRGSIGCPSLHVFGNDPDNHDRQISNEASRHLASFFVDSCSVIMEHGFGHMIPTRSPFIDEIKRFLHCFL